MSQEQTELKIDLRQMIIALETTVDLVGMNDTNHGKRVGYIASQLAFHLGFDEQAIQSIFELGLLHDCGVSTEQMHSNLVNHFDWENVHIHCEIGSTLLKSFPPLNKFSIPILHHHTPWEELKTIEIDEHDALLANLIFLSDRIDVMAATHYESDILLARKEIVKSIKGYRGTYFKPEFVDAFITIEKTEAFWISLENRHVTRYTWDMGRQITEQQISISELKQLSLIMAYIVDQKSPFTAQHSVRVGALARYLATQLNLSETKCNKIEIAGLLHDIGKLRMPDDILEKGGPLSEAERSIMNQHSYETFEILRHIHGIEDIARWAAYHHEGIDGSGYPFHPSARKFSTQCRVIAIADVFQALVQERPYRKGYELDEVIKILNDFVEVGKLDKEISELAIEHGEKCFQIANGLADENHESELPLFEHVAFRQA